MPLPKSFIADDEEENDVTIPLSFVPDEEEKKPGFFSKAINALKPAEKIHPVDVVKKVKQFAEEHPKIRQFVQNVLTGSSPELEVELSKQGITSVKGEGLAKIPGADTLRDTIREKGIQSGNYWAGAAGSIAGDIIDLLSTGFDPRTAGVRTPKVAESLPIRRPNDYVNRSVGARDFKSPVTLENATPQQEAVAISMTKDMQPRNAANISTETGIPKSSVRRTLGELKKKGAESPKQLPLSNEAPEVPGSTGARFVADERGSVLDRGITPKSFVPDEAAKPAVNVAEYIKQNPTASMSDIEAFVNSVDEVPAKVELSKGINLNAVKEELLKQKATLEATPKKPFTSPFEKAKVTEEPTIVDERPLPTRSPNLDPNRFTIEGVAIPGESQIRPNINARYTPEDLAKAKIEEDRLVRNFSTSKPTEVPTAKYAGTQPGFEDLPEIKLYNVKGGKLDKSTVSAETLKKEGIEVPTEQPPVRGFEKATSKLQEFEDAALARIKQRGTFSGKRLSSGLPVDDLADFAIIGSTKIARGFVNFAEWSAEMISNFGESIRPHLKAIFAASKSHHEEYVGGAARKLFNSMVEAKGAAAEQGMINKVERARRFAASAGVKEEGVVGAAKSMAAMRGEYPKANPGEGIDLDLDQSNMLFTIIKRSKLDEPEKIQARSALFALFNGDRVPPPSELKVLDKAFGKYLRKAGGPGASGKYDLETPEIKASLVDYIAKNPNATKEEVKGFIDELKQPLEDSFEAAGEKLRGPKEPSKTRQIYELSRGFMSSDIPYMTSAAFRQGAPLAGTKNWFKAYAEQAKAFGDEAVYDKISKEIHSSPIFKQQARLNPSNGKMELRSIADDIGLVFADLKSLTTREEQIRAILSEKIPLYGRYVRANNRSYTTFLNSLRTRTAEDWLNAAKLIGEDGAITNMAEARKIGYTINELTGHGSLKIAQPLSRFTGSRRELDLENAADTLSLIFFSPRNTIRDARMMNPLNYIKNDKLVRTEYLKGAIRRAGVWAGFTTLAALAGAKVSSDPTSSDFGKAKLGNTRLDAGQGLLQWIVFMSRQALGESTSSSSGKTQELGSSYTARTRFDVAEEFMKNRLHPSLSLATDALTATKKRPFYAGSEVLERMLPMMSSDLHDIIKDDPDTTQILLGLLAASASMGSQTYGPKDFGKSEWNIPGDVKFKGGRMFGSSDNRRLQP